jgi:hypothetical protein
MPTKTATVKLPDDMPSSMKRLPTDDVGRPVPWFVPWVDGKPDFRLMDSQRLVAAIRGQLCFICGERLKRNHGAATPRGTFTAGPMCVVNRTSPEPPDHAECAEWSAKACPFLSRPAKERRTTNMPPLKEEPAGIAIMRNPGVTALVHATKWRAYPVRASDVEGVPGAGGGLLFEMTRIESVSWMAEGRKATSAEVMESIESGLPTLITYAEMEMGALPVLARRLRDALRFIENPEPYDYPCVMRLLGELR